MESRRVDHVAAGCTSPLCRTRTRALNIPTRRVAHPPPRRRNCRHGHRDDPRQPAAGSRQPAAGSWQPPPRNRFRRLATPRAGDRLGDQAPVRDDAALVTEQQADALTDGQRRCCFPLAGSRPAGAAARRSKRRISAAAVAVGHVRNHTPGGVSPGRRRRHMASPSALPARKAAAPPRLLRRRRSRSGATGLDVL